MPPGLPSALGEKPQTSARRKELETNTLILQAGASHQANPTFLGRAPWLLRPQAENPAFLPVATHQGDWEGPEGRAGQRVGTLPPSRVMVSQFLSLMSSTGTRLVQILQRPKWAASQVALWSSIWGLSTAQWSVTTATMASTMPTRMQKRATRTFSFLVWDMVVTEVRGQGAAVSPGVDGSPASVVAVVIKPGVGANFSVPG